MEYVDLQLVDNRIIRPCRTPSIHSGRRRLTDGWVNWSTAHVVSLSPKALPRFHGRFETWHYLTKTLLSTTVPLASEADLSSTPLHAPTSSSLTDTCNTPRFNYPSISPSLSFSLSFLLYSPSSPLSPSNPSIRLRLTLQTLHTLSNSHTHTHTHTHTHFSHT
jgi:hypothetical protein